MLLKLDARTIAGLALARGKDEEFCWDTELEGYGLRLRRRSDGSLRRSWVAQYRTNGHTRRINLGTVEKVVPAQAREAARKILARVALGHDPQAEKEAKRRQAAHTVRSAIDTYLDTKQGVLRPASFRVTRLYLVGSYFHPLHPLAVSAVTRADVATCIRTIARKHSGSTAAAARRALSAFFAWAIADGLLGNGANPVDGSHRPDDPKPRDRVLSDAELVAVWNACDGGTDFERIIRLLILLGSRRAEVGGMCWSELDFDLGAWMLPKERSKNGRGHTVPLSPAALALIKAVPRTTRDHLFGDRAGAGFTGWYGAKAELDRRLAGTVKAWRIHDLRRSVATKMADIGVEPHHVEAALNHFSGHRRGVAGIYNRSSYERAVKAALARWEDHVLGLAEGRESSNVVPMHA
jgi:integrase